MTRTPLSAPEIELRPDENAHIVQFYEEDRYLVDLVTRFLGVGLAAGDPLVAVLTDERRKAVCARLGSVGFDVEEACARSQLRFMDARATLDGLIVDGMPDAARLRAAMAGVIPDTLPRGSPRKTRVFGEMVDLLWRDGKPEAAIRLEEHWNGLQAQHGFNLLCAYSMGNAYRESHPDHAQRICGAHSRVMPDALAG